MSTWRGASPVMLVLVLIFGLLAVMELALAHGTASFAPMLGAFVALVGIGWLAGSAIGRAL